ncbi:MAG TPA: FAD binding domain-containing protein [Candidatus Thalassarchaeaceae archaeon]|nr:FAD binding domain-containing protein [Candidatus Thalassarchaeaceae archaeon]HJM76941.1 FAD binding domain-containing protein [Candidatus Thalassarchaeaceae archaeon]
MRMPPFSLHTPRTLDEALAISGALTDSDQKFDWVAGGTDLLPNYKWHLNTKSHVISLARVSELSKLSDTHIGAMVRLQDLVESETVHPLISHVSSKIASVMLRRSGTVGGNICLDTRCFWFNQSEEWRESIDWCHKCDCGSGANCRVIANQNERCVATYQADLAPALMCLGASVHLTSPRGTRSMALSEFFQEDGITKNVLEPGELVTHLKLPIDASEWKGDYQKLRQREAWDFPEAGVVVAWKGEGGSPIDLRVATTGLGVVPVLHQEASAVLDHWEGEASVEALAESIRKAVKPVLNTWFSPTYRRKMVKVLTKRASRGLLVR